MAASAAVPAGYSVPLLPPPRPDDRETGTAANPVSAILAAADRNPKAVPVALVEQDGTALA